MIKPVELDENSIILSEGSYSIETLIKKLTILKEKEYKRIDMFCEMGGVYLIPYTQEDNDNRIAEELDKLKEEQ